VTVAKEMKNLVHIKLGQVRPKSLKRLKLPVLGIGLQLLLLG